MNFGAFQLAYIGPGAPEFVVVALVLLLLFGAQDAPRMFRKLNHMLGQLRHTAEHFKQEIMYGDVRSDEELSEPDASTSDEDEDAQSV